MTAPRSRGRRSSFRPAERRSWGFLSDCLRKSYPQRREDDARKAGPWGGQIEMEREAQAASNALGERVVKLPWSERHEYEQQESELERQQGRESRGMSR